MKPGENYVGISTSFYCHDSSGNWLLHKRSDACRDEKGVWDSGGGKLEFNLTLEENVLKEIKEEYNCNARIQKQLPAITLLRKNDDGYKTHWIVVPFIVLIDQKEIINVSIGDKDKMTEIGWFSFQNMPYPRHSGLTKTIHLFKSYFKEFLLIG